METFNVNFNFLISNFYLFWVMNSDGKHNAVKIILYR